MPTYSNYLEGESNVVQRLWQKTTVKQLGDMERFRHTAFKNTAFRIQLKTQLLRIISCIVHFFLIPVHIFFHLFEVKDFLINCLSIRKDLSLSCRGGCLSDDAENSLKICETFELWQGLKFGNFFLE